MNLRRYFFLIQSIFGKFSKILSNCEEFTKIVQSQNAKNGIYIKNAINAQGTLIKIHEE